MDTQHSRAEVSTPQEVLANRYRIEGKLGEGGMGAVYLAWDFTLNRRVALKVLPGHSLADPDAIARFRREAQVLARLSHPNIVQAYDSGVDGDRHFLVMEHVEGRSLSSVLREKGRITPSLAADYACQAALALAHAHSLGIVHRDLKPSNLMLTADGLVKVLDLGLARFLQDQVGDATLTRAGSAPGTPDYCPPEQFREGHKADGRSDIYSLGCTLYQLIAGRVPFPGSSQAEKALSHESKEPPSLQELCPEAPGGLVLVVERMMAKRPADRFQTAGDVAEALTPFAAGSSRSFGRLRNTMTRSNSNLQTMPATPRRPRRIPALWAASGCVLIALAAAVIGVLVSGYFLKGGLGQQPTASELGSPQTASPTSASTAKVLTVSREPAGGGEYRTINQALDVAAAGQTIRIVDNSVYQEALVINRPRHEGLTLEATNGATLETSTSRGNLVSVISVRGVTLRGLRLRGRTSTTASLVTATGASEGLVLEELEFVLSQDGSKYNAVEIHDMPVTEGARLLNVLIHKCQFRKAQIGIDLSGIVLDGEQYGAARPVQNIVILDCFFTDCGWAVSLRGDVHNALVAGNRFVGCHKSAWLCDNLLPSAEGIVIANNTTFECFNNLRVWDTAPKTRGVRVVNNLCLGGPYPDAVAIDSGGRTFIPKGAGDGGRYAKEWSFQCNWREVKVPKQPPPKPDGWIPPGPTDEVKETIPGVNRDPKSPAFLKPEKDSPLASRGLGSKDSSFPNYVGAVPPDGVAGWDWGETWKGIVKAKEPPQ